MRFIGGMLMAALISAPALAQQSLELGSDRLQEAAVQAKIFEEASSASANVDAADRIAIVVSVPQTPTATIVVAEGDEEWAAVVAAVKTLSEKRKAGANQALGKIGLKAKMREDPVPAGPRGVGPDRN